MSSQNFDFAGDIGVQKAKHWHTLQFYTDHVADGVDMTLFSKDAPGMEGQKCLPFPGGIGTLSPDIL
jgi:hypothetical protein